MATEKELRARIAELEAQNSALQDKLDMIWSILADDMDVEPEEPAGPNLVQIDRKPS